jgi:hypothetical protein
MVDRISSCLYNAFPRPVTREQGQHPITLTGRFKEDIGRNQASVIGVDPPGKRLDTDHSLITDGHDGMEIGMDQALLDDTVHIDGF